LSFEEDKLVDKVAVDMTAVGMVAGKAAADRVVVVVVDTVAVDTAAVVVVGKTSSLQKNNFLNNTMQTMVYTQLYKVKPHINKNAPV